MKTELELKHLRVFVAVVECAGHTRAARALGLSQSTVSETMIALERTVGTALFRKTAKGSVLTASGEALLPYAKRTLALTGELMTALAKASASSSAKLVVAANESVSTYVLPPVLAALRERWPGARMEVITSVCSGIREHVAAGRCDLGLVLETQTEPADASILATSRLLVVGSPTHPLAHRRAQAEHLQRCDFYMSDAAGDYHQIMRQYFEAAQIPLPRTQTLGTIEGVKRGIRAGGTGLGLLPAHAVEQELREATLAEIPVSPALRGLVLRAVHPAKPSGSPLVEDLLRALRGAARPAIQRDAARLGGLRAVP